MALFLMIFGGTLLYAPKADAQFFSITFQTFYSELSPYGTWVYRPDYGYAWVPNAGPDFFPYATNGDWVYTNYGWTWVSYYQWGWAPFHYGRWMMDPYWGPMWVPGYEWSPAWVVWRSSGDYCGWAPLGPGISIDLAFGRNFIVPPDYWRFVHYRDFGKPHPDRYYVRHTDNVYIINQTTVINNTYIDQDRNVRYMAGPPARDVEKYTGMRVSPVAVKDRTKPGQYVSGKEVELYRPRVEKSSPASKDPAPTKVAQYEKMNPQHEKTMPAQQPPRQQPPKQSPPQHQMKSNGMHGEPAGKSQALPAKQQPKQEQVKKEEVRQHPEYKEPPKTGGTDRTAPVKKTPETKPEKTKQPPANQEKGKEHK